MFDWNDEELANIIWGEAGEGDDHIVPYPERGKDNRNIKERNQEGSATKLTEQKTLGTKHGFADAKLESSSNYDKDGIISSSGVTADSWPDLSSNLTKNDQETLTTDVSNDVSKTTKYDSTKVQSDRDHQIIENPQEEEQNDFVNYGWENIGSFDDLDRIFSNDEPLFGHVLGHADELWCSKDVTNSSLKSFSISGDSPKLGSEALTDASEILQVKAENAQKDDESLNLFGKLDDPPSLNFQHGNALLEPAGQDRDQSQPAVKEQSNFPVVGANTTTCQLAGDNILTSDSDYSVKVPRQRKHHKGQKKQEGKTEGRIMRDLYGAWSPPMMQQCAPSAMSQYGQLPGLDSFHYQHFANPYLYPPPCGNVPNPFPASPSMSHNLQSGKLRGQAMSGFEVSPGEVDRMNKRVGSSDKPPMMTPQEKIEKLRRRQQMHAMLAIQKQQEQFNNQASSCSIAQTGPVENQVQRLDEADRGVEDMGALPSVDNSSSVDQDDSNTISAPVDYAAEDIVLRRLQDVIAKLDNRIRLCIRDSLFRLAKSAVQRHYSSVTGSTNTCSKEENHEIEGLSKEDKHADNREVTMPDIETETNPIDRAVAHLLFHRPLESSVQWPRTPDSPLSTKLQVESDNAGATNSFRGSQTGQDGSHPGPTSPKDAQETDLLKNRSCLGVSENESIAGAGDGEAMEIEASR